ncbi:LOW QUALITY PROTEIN: uncharacterized protein [Panulirus ornatus]|uniref:LOW QUALITY PROTEIN: uncharacterized protein n=1 Tax=Panulirus ornatus TaxID=150431 RepID=UPI003A83EDB2
MTVGVSRLTEELVRAVQTGDSEGVDKALRAGADPHVLFHDDPYCPGGTLLCQASARNHAHLIPRLLEAGISVDDRGSQERTPLHVAAEMGHETALRVLLQHHGNIEATTKDEYKQTPLHRAAWTGAVKCVTMLLQAGANKNARTHNNYTPLHKAARKNQIDVIHVLIQAGCDLDAQTFAGWTALHVAGLGGCIEAAQVLLNYELDPTVRDYKERTPAILADVWGQSHAHWFFSKLPKVVLDSQPVSTRTFKDDSRAIYDDNEKVVLRWASEGEWGKLKERIPNIRDGHYQDKQGFTALHIAAQYGKKKTVKVLLEEGCYVYPRAITHDGRTPMNLAQSAGYWEVADLIQDALTSPLSVEDDEQLYGQLLEVICYSDNVKDACCLLVRGSPLEATGQFPTHALVLAVTRNRPRILTLLVAAGAPLTPVTYGLNLLQLAWLSPDVTTFVKMLVTRSVEHMLEEEARRASSHNFNELYQGISSILITLQGPHPWLACWPSLPASRSQKPSPRVMVEAAKANCPMTAVFLEQAGVMPFSIDECSGLTPLTAALRANHWELARHFAKTSGSLYIPDITGTLPRDLFPKSKRETLEKEIYDLESRILNHQREKAKAEEDKNAISSLLRLQSKLFKAYHRSDISHQQQTVSVTKFDMRRILLLVSQLGLVQLAFFLVKIGRVNMKTVVDSLTGTTSLHQAAAFGHTSLIAFLLRIAYSDCSCIDKSGCYPSHLAAMFGHDQAFEYLSLHCAINLCRVGNTPPMVRNNFLRYLQQYQKLRDHIPINEKPWLANSRIEAIKYHFQSLNLTDILMQNRVIDFKKDEAAEVRYAVMNELNVIMGKVSCINPKFQGKLELLGSAADETRLYAPDEYDINYVIKGLPDIKVKVVNLSKQEILLRGHTQSVEVHTDNGDIKKLLQNSNWKRKFFHSIEKALRDYHFQDHRLSLVPPGLIRTQVGLGLAFAWQGQEFPLLHVGIDLVPVMKVPWLKEVTKPFLTPSEVNELYLTNIENGHWRLSFAGAEASILSQLEAEERRTYLACKRLLSCMKAEPWMPRHVKKRFTWWDSRYWKIPAPCPFALKNSFLRELEHKRKCGLTWDKEDIVKRMTDIFRRMCELCTDPSTKTENLVPHKILAYFGGDFERPKWGVGAPEIVAFLQKSSVTKCFS